MSADTREILRWRSHAPHAEYVARISFKKGSDVGTQARTSRGKCKTESEGIDDSRYKEEMGKRLEGISIFLDALWSEGSMTIRYRRPETPWSLVNMTISAGAEAVLLQKTRLEALGYSIIDVVPPILPAILKSSSA